jgi:hypothetical protein
MLTTECLEEQIIEAALKLAPYGIFLTEVMVGPKSFKELKKMKLEIDDEGRLILYTISGEFPIKIRDWRK